MPGTVSPLMRDALIKAALARAAKGEAVPYESLPLQEPLFKCAACKDTAFVIEERLDGTRTAERCYACRKRVDAEIKAKDKYVVPDDSIPDRPAPREYDWKKAGGFDKEED